EEATVAAIELPGIGSASLVGVLAEVLGVVPQVGRVAYHHRVGVEDVAEEVLARCRLVLYLCLLQRQRSGDGGVGGIADAVVGRRRGGVEGEPERRPQVALDGLGRRVLDGGLEEAHLRLPLTGGPLLRVVDAPLVRVDPTGGGRRGRTGGRGRRRHDGRAGLRSRVLRGRRRVRCWRAVHED